MPKLLKHWKRTRVTTNVSGENALVLQELSTELNVPIGRVIDQALDDFFLKINARDDRSATPYDTGHLTEAAKRVKSRIETEVVQEEEAQG